MCGTHSVSTVKNEVRKSSIPFYKSILSIVVGTTNNSNNIIELAIFIVNPRLLAFINLMTSPR